MQVSIEDANPTFSHFISVASIAVTATPCCDSIARLDTLQLEQPSQEHGYTDSPNLPLTGTNFNSATTHRTTVGRFRLELF